MGGAEVVKNKEESQTTVFNVLKDEIFFIIFIIICVGVIYTDTYYQKFGVKYQYLDLPTFHVIYRGLTVIIDSPYIILPYLLALGIYIIDALSWKYKWNTFITYRVPLTYLVVFALYCINERD